MRRPWIVPIALALLLAGLGWIASTRLTGSGDRRGNDLLLAATVRSDPVAVLAPSLGTSRAVASSASPPTVAGRLASIDTSVGTRVEVGQVIARFDDRALTLALESAKASARGARARVGVIDANLDTVADNAAQLATAKRKLDDALAKLRASRPEVVRNLEQARALVRGMPPTLPPGAPDPRVLVAKLEAALARIDAGLAKAAAGRAKLNTGAAKLSDARSQLRGARGVLTLVAEAADTGVVVAEARRGLAAIRAPYAGTVTWIAEPGSVLFAGGPVARLMPDGPLLLDTYADAGEATLVRVGASATASSDSFPGHTFAGHVSGIRPVYEFPPTALPTTLIHMTRAFRVTVTLDDTAAPLPAGTPADLTISTRSGS
jgi:HlyD family secretion protein